MLPRSSKWRSGNGGSRTTTGIGLIVAKVIDGVTTVTPHGVRDITDTITATVAIGRIPVAITGRITALMGSEHALIAYTPIVAAHMLTVAMATAAMATADMVMADMVCPA